VATGSGEAGLPEHLVDAMRRFSARERFISTDRNRIRLVLFAFRRIRGAYAEFRGCAVSIHRNNYLPQRDSANAGGGWCTRRGSRCWRFWREFCCFFLASTGPIDSAVLRWGVSSGLGVSQLSQRGMVRHLVDSAGVRTGLKIRAG